MPPLFQRPPPGTKKTQAEIERDRLEKVQIRIGQQILKTIAPNRQAFGQSIKSIESIFIAMDEDGNGRLERHEFREGLKRLDLGINSTQFVELLKGFDADGSGDIDYAEFENFLIRCKAGEAKPFSLPRICSRSLVDCVVTP